MKKSLLVILLAVTLVFAFVAIAGATYQGFEPHSTQTSAGAGIGVAGTFAPAGGDAIYGGVATDISSIPGFMPWQVVKGYNSDPAKSPTNSAHGGYVTTSAKCQTCHSIHRAPMNPTAGIGVSAGQVTLAMGGGCEDCHTGSANVGSSLKVEWNKTAQVAHNGAGGARPTTGCLTCHGVPGSTGGAIHGGAASAFNGMNAYMLGNGQDAWIRANVIPQLPAITDPTDTSVNVAQTGRWFRDGTDPIPTRGNWPALERAEAYEYYITNNNWLTSPGYTEYYSAGGNRSLGGVVDFTTSKYALTGATCMAAGCHTKSMFPVIAKGSTNAGFTAGIENGSSNNASRADRIRPGLTGHSTPGTNDQNRNTDTTCGPCHPGAPVGPFRSVANAAGSNVASVRAMYLGSRGGAIDGTNGGGVSTDHGGLTDANVSAVWNSRAYGCDQCHDVIGTMTGSSAFPHGTQGINVYTRIDAETLGTEMLNGKNLWMYQANNMVSYAGAYGVTGANDTLIDGQIDINANLNTANYLTSLVDPSVSVITNAVSDGANYGRIADGACLKCHIAMDDASWIDIMAPDWNDGTRVFGNLTMNCSRNSHRNETTGQAANANYSPLGAFASHASVINLFK